MDCYPGSELTLAQLLHAMNRKLNADTTCISIRGNFTLQELDRLEASTLTALAGIRAFRNAFSPIHRLNPETLALIFRFCAQESFEDRWSVSLNESPYAWIAVTHVCRYWRNAALAFPSLWSSIDGARPAIARLCIERSKSALLDVRLRSGCSHEFFQRLPSIIGRMRSLDNVLPREQQALLFPYLADTPAPSLQSISINRPQLRQEDPTPPFPYLFQGTTPSLTKLVVSRFALKQSVGHMTNLVHLELRHDFPASAPSMTEFLNVLQSNPGLKELQLRHAGPRVDEGNPRRIVHLDHLQDVKFYDCASQVILQHLSLAVGAKITIREMFLDGTTSLLDQLLPKSLHHLPNIQLVDRIGFHLDTKYRCSVYADGPQGSIVAEGVDDNQSPDLQSFRSRSFRSLEPLSVSHVRELWVYGACWRPSAEASDNSVWKALCCFTGLETLVVLNGRIDAFLQVLHPTEDSILCPTLINLTLYDNDRFSPAHLLALAKARKAQGCPLERVSVICYPGRFAPPEPVMDMKEYVNEVEYKVDNEGPKWPFHVGC